MYILACVMMMFMWLRVFMLCLFLNRSELSVLEILSSMFLSLIE